MSGFLLDTNVPSELIHARSEPRVGKWIFAQPEATLYMSIVTIGELHKGFALLPSGKRRTELEQWFQYDLLPRFKGRILPLTYSIAERWGTLDARRQRAGSPMSSTDGMITATALEHRLILVTRNGKDFLGIDLNILNPWDTP